MNDHPSLPYGHWRFALALLLPLAALYSVIAAPQRSGWWALGIWALVAFSERLWRRSPPPASDAGDGARLWLRLYPPLQAALLLAGAWAAHQAHGWGTLLGVALLVGFVTGSQGISYAHELGHSHRRSDRLLAWLLMTSVGYPQFMVEHYRGHHPRVATWDDPATARRGESLWRFLPRTLWGSLAHAVELERQRLAARGVGILRRLRSPLLGAWLAIIAAGAILLGFGATKIVAFWLVQSAFAVFLLETVNYIEHYGLRRRAGADGRPQPFSVAHAWNADHPVTNTLLANLQRHSDHHLHAGKPFAALEDLPGPRLPTGYAGCLLLAALPPLWFALMHPRLDALASPDAG